jgi:hypothetical protein
MHALTDPIKTGEQAQARAHIQHLEGLESFKAGKELVIFDRGYPSKELIQGLTDKKIDYVMRVRTKFSKAIDARGLGDHMIELEHGKKRLPVRVIKLELDSKEVETLITSLTDTKYSVEDFKWLYFKRGPVETKYDVIKKKLGAYRTCRILRQITAKFFDLWTPHGVCKVKNAQKLCFFAFFT